ncbi:MAG: hypothetical protein PHS44_01250 [Candidatus Dojkabacteria bacterium]|nr:hypothetical protein [Candidatus Dojkabacteria bacterium]
MNVLSPRRTLRKSWKILLRAFPFVTILFLLVGYIAPIIDFIDFGAKAAGFTEVINMNEDQPGTHSLEGWSDPDLPGNFGGCNSGTNCHYRQIIERTCREEDRSASVVFDADNAIINSIRVRHLDGLTDDSFDVYLNDTNLIGTYSDQYNDETWLETSFPINNVSGEIKITLTATGDIWNNCSSYGQVAVNWIEINGYTIPSKPVMKTVYKGHDSGSWEEIGCGTFENPTYTNTPQISLEWYSNPETDIDGYWFGTQFNDHHQWVDHPNVIKNGNMTPGNNPYYYTVIAKNHDGIESEISERCYVILDQVAPEVEVTSHDDGGLVYGEIDIRGSVTDDNPHHYWAVVHNAGGDEVAGPGTVSRYDSFTDELIFSWDTTLVPDGTYTIKLEARDAADNKNPDQAPVPADPEIMGDSVDWVEVEVMNEEEPPVCGDGTVNGNEECDYGELNGSYNCNQDCTWNVGCRSELIANGGFEIPSANHSKGWDMYDSDEVPGWSASWYGGSESYGGQARPEDAKIEIHSSVNGWTTPDDQYIELDTDWVGPDESLNNEPASISLYQDIPTMPGYEYQLSWSYSPRPSHSDNRLEVKVADNPIFDSGSMAGDSSINWHNETYTFTTDTNGITRIRFTEAGNPDSLGMFLDKVSVECLGQVPPQGISPSVTVCKWNDANENGEWDGQEKGIADWDMIVHPEGTPYWQGTFDSSDYTGVDSSVLEAGHKYLVEVEGVWYNFSDNRRAVDAEYISDDSWTTQGDTADDPARDIRQLDVVIDDTNIDWGSYNPMHLYKTVITGEGESVNFRVYDEDGAAPPAWFGDNDGSLDVRIYDVTNEIYTTTENGCVTVDVEAQDYQILEMTKDGWEQTYPQNPDFHHVSIQQELYWADSVINFDQGLRKNGSQVLASRSTPESALDMPDATTNPDSGFVSLGFRGWIELRFMYPVADVDGMDLSFHEVTNGRGSYPQEKAKVEVSQDGVNWEIAGEVTNDESIDYLDFATTGLKWIQYVRITDTTDSSIHDNISDGYDLDAVDATSIWYSFGNKHRNEPRGSIWGRKYDDLNINHTIDTMNPGHEPFLNDWTIRLYDADWNFLSSEQTGHTGIKGQYRFHHLTLGTYYVCEVMQEEWMQSAPIIGQTNADQNPSGDQTGYASSITNQSGAGDEGSMCWMINLHHDNRAVDSLRFGNYEIGSVNGYKYEDKNVNGRHNGAEPRLEGWEIVLGNYEKVETAEIDPASTVPVNLGMLENGEYYVIRSQGTFEAGDGITADAECSSRNGSAWKTYVQNYEEHGESLLDLELFGETTDWGLCNAQHTYTKVVVGDGSDLTALIKDIYKPNNTGHLTLDVYKLSNVLTDTTDENGYYEIEGVQAGVHLLCEVQQPGWAQTEPTDVHSGGCYLVSNHRSHFERSYNFGNIAYGIIQGRKYFDANASGDREQGEPWLNEWQISLYDEEWKEISKMSTGDDSTSAGEVVNGQYRFVNLHPGKYYICEENRTTDNWMQTEPDSEIMHDGLYCYETQINRSGQRRGGLQFGNLRNSVTLCKKDSYGNPLQGWELALLGEPVDTVEVGSDGEVYLSDDLTAGEYTVVVRETYSFWPSCGVAGGCIADAGYSLRPAGSPYSYHTNPYPTWVSGEDLGTPGGLEIKINGANIDWGNFNPEHNYYHLMSHPGGTIDFNIWDSAYGDNSGSLTVEIYEGTFAGTTGADGCVTFDPVPYGDYTVEEQLQDNWENVSGLGEVTIDEQDEEFTVVNEYQLGDLKVCKFEDTNGDGEMNETEAYMNWELHVSGQEDVSQGEDECYTWKDIAIGEYEVTEVNPAGIGWGQTALIIDDISLEPVNPATAMVEPGQTTTVVFGNYPIPELTIQKENNRVGEILQAGDNVEYTIRVKAWGNDVDSVNVTDLLPEGFAYMSGSWSATSDIRGDLKAGFITPEPTYASPGDWDLGDMSEGEVVTLKYTANISSTQEDGIYPDLAWTQGEDALAELVIGMNEIRDDYFAGTEVEVASKMAAAAEVEIEEGEVLGALAVTGQNTLWAAITGVITLLGIGIATKNRKKLSTVGISAGVAVLGLIVLPGSAEAADSVKVSIQQPRSPINVSIFEIGYVALDTNNNPITIQCLKQGPTDASLSQYGSDQTLDAGGDSGKCIASVSEEGTYYFQVKANGVASQVVKVVYDSTKPGVVTDYSKEKAGECKYQLSFTTASDGGETVGVEIFRSAETSFVANESTLVKSLVVGSNETGTYTDTVPNCSKTYYYVVRAIDDAGNFSAFVGDKVLVTTESETAITNPTGGETTPAEEEPNGGQTEENGDVLGEQTCEQKQKLSGYVKNQDGEGVENAEVDIYEVVEGEEKYVSTVKTNAEGYWEAEVCPGEYNTRVKKESLPEGTVLEGEEVLGANVEEGQDTADVNFEVKEDKGLFDNFKLWWCLIPLGFIVVIVVLYMVGSRGRKVGN